MSLPLAIFLVPYALYLLIFGIFSIVDIAHLVKYRSSALTGFLVTFIYLAGTVLILYGTWFFLADVNWNEPFTLFGSLNLEPSLEF